VLLAPVKTPPSPIRTLDYRSYQLIVSSVTHGPDLLVADPDPLVALAGPTALVVALAAATVTITAGAIEGPERQRVVHLEALTTVHVQLLR